MLKEKISADYMSAFKAKNTVAKNLLSVIKSEIQTLEKNLGIDNLSDEEVTKILNKTAKSLKETKLAEDNNIDTSFPSAQTAEELFIVESYLPKQMSEDEIRVKVQELISENDLNIAEVMRAFASYPADRKLVAEVYHSLKTK
jgi:uncharacterized protein YqeY